MKKYQKIGFELSIARVGVLISNSGGGAWGGGGGVGGDRLGWGHTQILDKAPTDHTRVATKAY